MIEGGRFIRKKGMKLLQAGAHPSWAAISVLVKFKV